MQIRNFCIIAHIDHGKSTLADRMLELTHTVAMRDMKAQILDQMELEREKGITIKLQPVRMAWQNDEYILNLIDTPGHVDFQYEVSRSLQAVEGAVLLVDATQGIQAQTLSNLYLALEQNLTIIPVINKIDLPAADVPRVTQEIVDLVGVKPEDILLISAKTGKGVEELLNAVVDRVPSPQITNHQSPVTSLKALIFDSVYDDYKGVVAYVRVMEGEVTRGDDLAFVGTGASDRAVEVGVFRPALAATQTLGAGEIGYIATGLKEIRQARVGDTIVLASRRDKAKALAGFHVPQPKVFAGIYPASGDDFHLLREAIGKLQLNDASFTARQEQNRALGQGYRCGFLGMLHLEIIQERLRREHDLNLAITTPSVRYQIEYVNGKTEEIETPDAFPDPSHIAAVKEQMVNIEIVAPSQYLGGVFTLLKEHEGELTAQEHVSPTRVILRYRIPLREIIIDLYDQLKSATAGYGSMSYEISGWQAADVVKLNFLINHEPVEALATIVPRVKAEVMGRRMVKKLKDVIPKQLFAVPIQAAVGGKFVARETLPALRKDVTAGLYGGDVTRKRKLLEKQKKGKKKLATGGSIEIPPSAFIEVLRR